MRRITKITAAAAIAAAAIATPVVAQSLNFGIDIGPRYESHPNHHGYRYAPPSYGPYYYAPAPGNCYADSLHGRVCID